MFYDSVICYIQLWVTFQLEHTDELDFSNCNINMAKFTILLPKEQMTKKIIKLRVSVPKGFNMYVEAEPGKINKVLTIVTTVEYHDRTSP